MTDLVIVAEGALQDRVVLYLSSQGAGKRRVEESGAEESEAELDVRSKRVKGGSSLP